MEPSGLQRSSLTGWAAATRARASGSTLAGSNPDLVRCWVELEARNELRVRRPHGAPSACPRPRTHYRARTPRCSATTTRTVDRPRQPDDVSLSDSGTIG